MSVIRVERVGRSSTVEFSHGDQDHIPTMEFVTDSFYGLAFKAMSFARNRLEFVATDMVRVALYDGAGVKTVIDHTYIASSQTTDPSGIITITSTSSAPYAGITITITMTPKYGGYTYTMVATNSTTYAIDYIEFPRCRPKFKSSAANQYLTDVTFNGQVIRGPQAILSTVVEQEFSGPVTVPFSGYYDAGSGDCLMGWMIDPLSRYISYGFSGDGTYVTFFWGHRPPNGRTAGNDYTQPYTGYLEYFVARRPDATICCEMASRYKAWARATAQPWTTTKWYDNASVSARVKSVRFHISDYRQNGVSTKADVNTDIGRLNDFYALTGSHRGILRTTNWSLIFLPEVSVNPEPLALAADVEAELLHTTTGVQGKGWHVAYYTLPLHWDTNLVMANGYVGPYQFNAFDWGLGAQDLTNYCQLKQDQSLYTINTGGPFPGVVTNLDISNFPAEVIGITSAVLDNYYALTVTYKPRSWYLDVFGFLPAFNYRNTVNPNGNNGAMFANIRSLAAQIKADRVGADPDFFLSTEGQSEQLVGVLDVSHVPDYDSVFPTSWAGNFAFGEHQRFMHYGIHMATISNDVLNYVAAQEVIAHWLHTGVLSFIPPLADASVMSAAQAAAPSTPVDVYPNAQAAWFFHMLLRECKKLTDVAEDMFRGELLRPLSGSWYEAFWGQTNNQSRTLLTYLVFLLHVGKLWEAAWRAPSGYVGLLFVNANVSTADSRYASFNVTTPIVRQIEFDPLDFGMDPDRLKTAVLVDSSGSTTTLGTFTTSFSYALTVAASTAYVLKITQS